MAFCLECGTQLPDRAKFCSNCGLQLTAQPPVVWDEPVTPVPAAPETFEPSAFLEPPAAELEAFAPPLPTREPIAPVAPTREPIAAPLPTRGPIAAPLPTREAFAPPVLTREPFVPPEPRSEPWREEPSEESSAEEPDDEPLRGEEPPPFAPRDVPDVPRPAYIPSEFPDVTPLPPPFATSDLPDELPPPPFATSDLPDEPPPPLSASEIARLSAPRPQARYESYVRDEPSVFDDLPPLPPEPPPPVGVNARSWFARNKLITALLVVLVLVAVTAILSTRGEDAVDNTITTQSPGSQSSAAPSDSSLFPGRTKQAGDEERNIGESVSIDGVQATVTAASFQQTVSDADKDGYIVADVAYVNNATDSKPYAPTDWKLEQAVGAPLDVQPVSAAEQLTSGDLVAGSSAAGKVTFKVGTQKGDFYIIWKPSPFAAAGVWKVTVA